MREFDADFTEYENDLLNTEFDDVSPDFDDGSILQEVNSGRDGSGGVTFTPATTVNGGNYPLWIGKQLTAQSERTVQVYVEQPGAQGTLGGRLLTLVDAPEDVFGATVQVAINIMSDNKLKAWRATTANSGIILRNTDQAGDSQMTLLGTSSGVLDGTDYLEISVVHHATAGSITVYKDNVLFWSLTNVNTAVSGRSQSTTFLLGGYGVTGDGDDVLHHEDLDATISDLMVINGETNPDDPNDPTGRIGDHKPLLSVPEGVGFYSQLTADPAGPNWSNVEEIPPDGASEVYAPITDLRDTYQMDDVAGTGTNHVYLTHRAYVRADTPAECSVSDTPASFEAFVYMEQTEPGTCLTSVHDTSACNFTDFVSRRAQSTCTINANAEAVRFKINLVNQDGMWVFLTPLDAPPRVLNASGGSRYTSAVFNGNNRNVEVTPAQVRYSLPYYQPWLGYAVDTQDNLDSTSDFVEFRVLNIGTGVDVVLIDNAEANVFNPYTSPLTGFHFREDVIGSPYFWIGNSFAYNGETIYSYSETDNFKMTRNGTDVQMRQNASLLETIAVTFPTHTNVAAFMGRWGWDGSGIPPAYSLRPGIKQCFVQIGGTDCVIGNYTQLTCLVPGTFTGASAAPKETSQWGVQFDPGDGVTGDATVFDPGGPNSPNTPVFGYNEDTQLEYSLVGGSVVLTITDWVSYADNMTTVVGNVATWTYTRPFADTDDFTLQAPASGYSVGVPTFPSPSLEYAFVNAEANAPLKLGVICSGNSDFALPEHAGVKDVNWTFLATENPTEYAGVMRQDGADRTGTVTEASSAGFRFNRSFQSSTPSDTPVTLADANEAEHGPLTP